VQTYDAWVREFWARSFERALQGRLRFYTLVPPVLLVLIRAGAMVWPIQDPTLDSLTWSVPIAVTVGAIVVASVRGPWLVNRDLEDQFRALQDRSTPRLKPHYKDGVRPYRQFDATAGIPAEYVRIGIKNTSESQSVEGVQARIEQCEPPDDVFETNEPLEMMGGSWHPFGRRVDPGQDVYVQVVQIVCGAGNVVHHSHLAQGDVKIHYALEAQQRRYWDKLPPGEWVLTIAVWGAHSPTVRGRYRLTVDHGSNDTREVVKFTPLPEGAMAENPPAGPVQEFPPS